MKKNNAVRESMFSRLIDDITFHASLLALHAAISSSGTELKKPLEAFGSGPYSDGPLHSLVELTRRPAKSAEPLSRSDSRALE